MTEQWKEALDNCQYVGILFVDFKKAFGSVNRDILKRKLQYPRALYLVHVYFQFMYTTYLTQ